MLLGRFTYDVLEVLERELHGDNYHSQVETFSRVRRMNTCDSRTTHIVANVKPPTSARGATGEPR